MIITKIFTFDAAHCLSWHQGKCKNLHGHTYKLEISIMGSLDNNGVVMDFGDLKNIVNKKIIKKYDHTYLNEEFENPTAELMVERMWGFLTKEGLKLYELKLWETPNSYAMKRIK